MQKKRIAILSTGGTIEKVYDELEQKLVNQTSVLERLLDKLVLGGVTIDIVRLMNKDSLDMTDDDHNLVAEQVHNYSHTRDGIVIVHGTDRLAVTGERICQSCPNISVPVVLTGAMRPFEMHTTDAMQNVTESLLAVQLCQPGVYVAMHNRVLQFPGVVKDYERRTFVRLDET